MTPDELAALLIANAKLLAERDDLQRALTLANEEVSELERQLARVENGFCANCGATLDDA